MAPTSAGRSVFSVTEDIFKVFAVQYRKFIRTGAVNRHHSQYKDIISIVEIKI